MSSSRIVSLIPSATECLVALGLEDRLVGITHSCDYPPDLAASCVTSTVIPKDASSREIDRIVKQSARDGEPLYSVDARELERLEPDLVVTQAVCDVCAVGEDQTRAELENLSCEPEIISLHPHRLDDVLDDLRRLGTAAHVESSADAVVASMRRRISKVEERVAGRPRPRVVVLEWLDPLFAAGHWTPEIVELAGGHEVIATPGQRSREMEWHEIVAADPDVLLIACCGLDEDRSRIELARLADRPGFSDLRAVRSDRIYVADGGAYFSRPGPRLIDSLELLAESLHPSGRLEVHTR